MTGSRMPKISRRDQRIIDVVREFDALLARPGFVLRMAHARMTGAGESPGATTQVLKACKEIDEILRKYSKRRAEHLRGDGGTS